MRKKIFLILGIVWMISVFLLSAQIGEDSSNTSGIFVDIIIKLFPRLNEYIDLVRLFIRKFAHFTIYAIGASIFFNLFKSYNIKYINCAICAQLICILYAITDEIHQFFVPGRACSAVDVIIDSLGALAGILFVMLIIKVIQKMKSRFKCNKES